MGKLIDLTGKKFGRLTVVKFIGLDKRRNSIWECKCECGTTKNINGQHLRNGTVISCGCYISMITTERNTTHGLSHDRIYRIYYAMKERCYNQNNHKYNIYGNRGITICDEWLNDFQSFYKWSIENGYNENLTIDRIDNNKGYEPSNCRWVSVKVQSRNKSSNKIYEINGVKKTFIEWCEFYNVPRHLPYNRIRKGWNIIEALTTPPLKKYKSRNHN